MHCRSCGADVRGRQKSVCIVEVSLSPVPKRKDEKRAWRTGTMIWLIIGSLVLPLFGMIVGVLGMVNPHRRLQGLLLFLAGLITDMLWVF